MREKLKKLKLKKSVIATWICLTILIASCSTIEYVKPDYQLPPEPDNYQYNVKDIEQIREELSAESDKLLQQILLEYITNLQEWKAWSNTVKEIIDVTSD